MATPALFYWRQVKLESSTSLDTLTHHPSSHASFVLLGPLLQEASVLLNFCRAQLQFLRETNQKRTFNNILRPKLTFQVSMVSLFFLSLLQTKEKEVIELYILIP